MPFRETVQTPPTYITVGEIDSYYDTIDPLDPHPMHPDDMPEPSYPARLEVVRSIAPADPGTWYVNIGEGLLVKLQDLEDAMAAIRNVVTGEVQTVTPETHEVD